MADQLEFSYGSRRVLSSVSFSVTPGTVYGLLGRNGAGKTTALNVLAGLLRPSGGQARLAGHSVTEEPLLAKRELGFVPDEPTAGLDPAGLADLKQILRAAAGRGCAVLISSHHLDVVRGICDRTGILHRGVIAAAQPLPAVAVTAIAIVGLAAVAFPVIGGLSAGLIAGGARVYLAADGARAAPGSAAVFVLLAVAGAGLLLPSRAQRWRGLERLIAIQPVPAARAELLRRLDDSALAFSVLLVLAGPLLFEVSGQPATSTAAVRLSPGGVVPAVAGVVILAVAASVTASILRTARARPGTLNRAGQIVLACSVIPLCYAGFSYFAAGLPRLTGLYAAVLSPLAWARYLPVAGQVTDAAIGWGQMTRSARSSTGSSPSR